MKKIILLIFVVFLVFVVINRTKLFVRDPLASVTRDGVKETGTQVFINFSNEVLLENDNAPAYVTVVELDGHIGAPKGIQCLHWMACLLDANPATLVEPPRPGVKTIQATGKVMEYTDASGKNVVVTLR